MASPMIEKIFARHSEDEVAPGNVIWLDLDIRSARDFGGANVVKNFREHYGSQPVDDPSRTFFTFDCVVPAKNVPYANNQQICRDFAREQGIKVHDVDMGIGSHVIMEEGLALPGSTVVGTDSHLNIMGAIGAFGQGMGDQDIAFAFKAGRTWFEVPDTMRIDLVGTPPAGTTARDVTLATVGELGSKGALGRAAEFFGDTIDGMSLAGRITLASMGTEMGAVTILIPPNDEVLEHSRRAARERGGGMDREPVFPDDEAEYVETVEIDVSDLRPKISRPPRPDRVVDVEEMADIEVDSVFIGSCTNGTYEDLAHVSDLVKGHRVHERVMAKVVPATRRTFSRLLDEGRLKVLHDAGFIISNPGCGGCASGQIGMTGEGEVQVSTSNRNFEGKQGAGDTYLASPATAAATAVLGRIATAGELGSRASTPGGEGHDG